MTRLFVFLVPVAVAAFLAVHVFGHSKLRADFRVKPNRPVARATTIFEGSSSSCDARPCSYHWSAKALRTTRGSLGDHFTSLTGTGAVLKYVFVVPGTYVLRLTIIDRAGRRAVKERRITVLRSSHAVVPLRTAGLTLPHDPNFVGPGYWAKFSHGPSSSMSYFPIYTYSLNLAQWSGLASRIKAMGVNGVDDAYDQSDQSNFDAAAGSGLALNINGGISGRANSRVVTSYAMRDEPNNEGSRYAATSCSPSNDTCAQEYVKRANAYRATDPTRPVWGNFTGDIEPWPYPPSGWTTAQYQQHNRTMIGALNVASADVYGWTSQYEWNQSTGGGNGHYGAWVYGKAVDRLRWYNPKIPVFDLIECCDSWNSPPTNTMTPGMIEASIWNVLAHGARGYVFWTTDFYDSHGDPGDKPYRGATYWGNYAIYGDHQWDAQYARAAQVNHEVKAFAPELNSPTVSGVTASSSSGVPIATLGKDHGGRLWLLAQADGDEVHQLSNTSPTEATITLPSTVPAGTVLTVVDENRTVTVNAKHQITDKFGTTTETPRSGSKPITYGYQHHFYKSR